MLGTYADSGNAHVLLQRARWAGLNAAILPITADGRPPTLCDLYLVGGGEDTAQGFAVDWLMRHRHLVTTLRNSARILAVCAGLQMLGGTITDPSGACRRGLSVLDIHTMPGPRRAVGPITTRAVDPALGVLVGFENHRGVTSLGPGLLPLGRVVTGVGNGVALRFERRMRRAPVDGVLTDRVVGTYFHGPVLALNPALADLLLHRITGSPVAPVQPPPQLLIDADLAGARRTRLGEGSRRAAAR